jgi:hypothetical protein
VKGAAERLTVCHRCRMIGSQAEGEAHLIARGHEIETLSPEASDRIREIQAEEQAGRVNTFIQLAKNFTSPAAPTPDPPGRQR